VNEPASSEAPSRPGPSGRPRTASWRIAGVPVHLHPSFLVLGALVAILIDPLIRSDLPTASATEVHLVSTAIGALLLLSVALHELAHAIAGRALDIPIIGVHLWGLGGSTALSREPETPRAQYYVSVSGPLVNLLLGGIAALVWQATEIGTMPHEFGLRLAAANAMLAAYNLLPGLPLDGGQIVRAGVWALTGDKVTGLRVAGYGGLLTAAFTALLALSETRNGGDYGLFTFLIAVFIALQAQQALRAAGIARRLPTVVAGALARPAFLVGEDLPLAEALRRAAAGGRTAVIYGTSDRPDHVLSEVLLAQVPTQRRPWVPLSSVVRPALPLDAQLSGEDLLDALRRDGPREHVVMNGDELVGVLRTSDVAAALNRSGA
jgi:Zn-dependent protease